MATAGTHHFPDHAGASLLNLMASVRAAHGRASGHRELDLAPAARIGACAKTVLVIVDGLGHEMLERAPPGGWLRTHLRGAMTSVLPSTTATAVTTLLTGVAPRAHGLLGWFIWLAAHRRVILPLPFELRGPGPSRAAGAGIEPAAVYASGLGEWPGPRARVVQPSNLAGSRYTRHHTGQARVLGHRSLDDLVQVTAGAAGDPEVDFVAAYWPRFDRIAHESGVASEAATAHLREIDAALERLAGRLAGTGACLLVTADHGFVDTTPESWIDLADHSALAATLRAPLCGEPRLAICHLRAGAHDDFDAYAREHLGRVCDVETSSWLLESAHLGPGATHPDLASRAGDRLLLLKANHAIRERLPGERGQGPLVGVHGGTSRAEMLVPLIEWGP